MNRLSDYVIDFIAKQGVKHIFMVAGGSGMFLIDSLGRSKDIQYICNHHEQASSMSAEAYQRITGNLGVALVTTGPASTNAITGLLCAWNDSIPLMIISGQANSKFLIGDTGLRQRGNHEVNITKIVESVTKYAVTVKDEKMIKYHLEKALYLAKTGRPGPVWIDIPIDIQGKIIDDESLISFEHEKEFQDKTKTIDKLIIEEIKELFKKSKRPVIMAGNGIRLSESCNEFFNFIEKYNIPVVTTKNSFDMIPDDYRLLAGRIGTYGQRSGNFTIQTSDLIIALGCRLCFTSIGYATEDFARNAKKIVVDVDENQLKYSHIKIDIPVNADIKYFIKELDIALNSDFNNDITKWVETCNNLKRKYPVVTNEIQKENKFINSYYFFDVLSEEMNNEDILVCDQGATFYSFTVAFKVKKGQKAFTNGGFSPMGYGLPASIGACFANDKKRVICAHGDGGLQLNIQELQTIVHHNLPIKLFVINNNGYTSIKHTQMNYFDGFFVGSDPSSGLTCPEISKIAKAYGIKYLKSKTHSSLRQCIKKALEIEGPVIVELFSHATQPIQPRVVSEKKSDGQMVSKPLEDMFPFIDRFEFNEIMSKK